MLNSKFISLDRVIDRVFKSGLNPEFIDFNDLVEYIGEAIRLIGVPYAHIRRVTNGLGGMPKPIVITDFRGLLPTDIVHLDSVREYTTQAPMLYMLDTFPVTYKSSNAKTVNGQLLGYYVQDKYIFTNLEEGELEASYTAFQVDSNGYPMIPDEERYITAVVAYCTQQIARRLWIADKLDERKFRMFEQEWLWYVNSAASQAHMPNLDRMESFKNLMVRMLTNPNHHANQFKGLNRPETLNL